MGCLSRCISTGLRAGAGFEVLEGHIHTFVVEPPGGPVSRGECECGCVREDFSNSWDHFSAWKTDWETFWAYRRNQSRSREIDRVEDWADSYEPDMEESSWQTGQ